MRERGHDPETRIIYALCIAVTTPFIVAAFVRRAPIGADTTLCILIAAIGIAGLIIDLRRRTRLPRARAQFRPRETDETVLIVEDDARIRQFLQATLASHGFPTIEAATLGDGKRLLANARPAVVLLDLGLPDGDGLELLRALGPGARTPVIVLSARDREHDKIAALDAGADDYLLKPFDIRELVTRVSIAVQRARMPMTEENAAIVAGPVRIEPARGSVIVDGKPVALTRTELRLLVALARQPGKLVTYRELIDAVWGADTVHQPHDVRVHVAALRRKVEPDPAWPRWIVAEIGVGYRLRVDHL